MRAGFGPGAQVSGGARVSVRGVGGGGARRARASGREGTRGGGWSPGVSGKERGRSQARNPSDQSKAAIRVYHSGTG